MACRRWISCGKRIISFIVLLVLCTCIIFVCLNRPKEVKAEPITGAVVITGAILAFLAACGVELTSSDMNTTTLQQCVEDMTSDYTYDNKTGASSWYADAGTVANIIWGGTSGDKTVILGSAFSQWLSGLPSFLENKYGLNTSSSSSIVSDTSIGGLDGNYSVCQSLGGGYYSAGTPLFDSISVGESFTIINSSGDRLVGSITEISNYDGYWERYFVTFSISINGGSATTISAPFTGGVNALNNNNVFITTDGNGFALRMLRLSSHYAGSYLYDLSTFLGSDVPSMSLEGSLVDGYQDLQDAMDEALGRIATNVDGVIGLNVGAMEGTITQEDVWERIYADSLENSLSSELTGSYEDEEEAKEELEQDSMPTASEMTGNVVVIDGLEDFFPFCIPFDLYEIISLLNVSPVAPKFEWTMNFAGIFDDYDIEIDLSDWETVAQVFRVMVVIGFAVFLILKTRDLIRG